jgi:hypothetical protein
LKVRGYRKEEKRHWISDVVLNSAGVSQNFAGISEKRFGSCVPEAVSLPSA